MLLIEIIETEKDLSGTGISRPLQGSSGEPPDAKQPSTSDPPDLPDVEELMDTTPGPTTMAQDLSGWWYFKYIFPLIPGLCQSLFTEHL